MRLGDNTLGDEMSTPEILDTIHELEAYGYVVQVETDEAIEDALTELAMCEPEEGD